MRFLRSKQSSSPQPPQVDPSNAVGVDVPGPKSSHGIREFFRFGRPHKQKPPQAASSNPNVIPSSSRPFSEPDLVQDAPVSAAHGFPSYSASPFSHSSQFVTSPIAPNATQMLAPPGPVVSAPSIHRASPSPAASSDPDQSRDLLVDPQPQSATVLVSQGPTMPLRRHSPQPREEISDPLPAGQNVQIIHESRNVIVDGNSNNVTYKTTIKTGSNKFMEKLLDKTIQGAAFDSSARDPPPRCHPGTRLAILERCLKFIDNAGAGKKVLWVVGQAGVGKSAIMQNIAESPLPSVSERASIFLSINGRNDGAKIIITLAYQLATKCKPYREFIELELTREPSLLQSSMSAQFKKFFIEPFINTPLSNSVGRILIIIDGLDECDKPETQRELLRLISDICSAHASSPIVWIIASRPEHQITSFFAQENVQVVYEKEEILVDSDEARSDVERFLRAELLRIQQEFSLSPQSQWPREQDFWKLASASGGLFVYAQTVTKYIGALAIADPISQLDDILKIIDDHPLLDVPREQHPLALLDALYARILSKIPGRIMRNTRKILLALVLDLRGPIRRNSSFLMLCNWLGMTCDEAYAAIRHLGSVLDVPPPYDAYWRGLQPFHKSFIDYLCDFTRSGFSSDIEHEAIQHDIQYTLRILEQAPGGMDCSDTNPLLFFLSGEPYGILANVPGAVSNIVLTWPFGSDREMCLDLYRWACLAVVMGIKVGYPASYTEVCIRTMTTQLRGYIWPHFPFGELINVVFEKSRRHEFMKSGLLKSVPLKELDFTHMRQNAKLQFRRPSGTTTDMSDPWSPFCHHERVGDWGEGRDEDWMTNFGVDAYRCNFCFQRLEQQLENQMTRSPDRHVTILLTSAEESFLEFHFIDPDDGVSEWTYWIILEIPEEKRTKPGGTAYI